MARGAGMAGSSSMARPFARYVSFNVLGMVGVSVYILAVHVLHCERGGVGRPRGA